MNQLKAPVGRDEDEEITFSTAEYKGLFYGWECPDCQVINYEDETDPRSMGVIVECECGWRGRVEE